MTTYNTGNPIGSTDARDRLDNTENMDYLENSTTELTHPDRLGTVRKTRHGMEVEHDAQIAAHETEHDNQIVAHKSEHDAQIAAHESEHDAQIAAHETEHDNQIVAHKSEHDAQIAAHESEHDAQMQAFESDFDGRLAGMAFTRVGSFTTGATLTDMRQVLIWEAAQGGDAHEYSWAGTFPKVVAAGATPATSGGIGAGAWVDRTQETLRSELSNSDGFSLIGQVASVGALRLLDVSALSNGDQVLLKSYHYGQGLGGGVIYYDATDTTSTHNGITTFVTVGGARLKRLKSEYVTFTKAGVLPGSVDNTAAITRINAYTGASIRVDLDFNCPLAIVNSSIKSIDVDSGDARRITWTNATSNGFHLTHSSGIDENNPITIDKIQNISTFAPLCNDCIRVTSDSPAGSTGVSIESNRVTFKGKSSTTGWRHGWALTGCKNVRINGLSFLGDRDNITSGAAVRITGTNSPVETMLHQCQAFFCAGLVEVDGNAEGLYLSQCTAIIVTRGVAWYNTGGTALRPYITIQQCHIYAGVACIDVQDVQHFNIGGGNAFYSLYVGTADQSIIRISTTIPNTLLDGIISGNIMYSAFGNSLCKGVEIFSSDATIKSAINITGNEISGVNDVLFLHDFVNGVRFGRDNSCNNYASKYTVSANATFDNDLPYTKKTSTNIRNVDSFVIRSKGRATVRTNAGGDATLTLPESVGTLVSATLTMCDALGTLYVNTSASTGAAIAFCSSLVNQTITVDYDVCGSIT